MTLRFANGLFAVVDEVQMTAVDARHFLSLARLKSRNAHIDFENIFCAAANAFHQRSRTDIKNVGAKTSASGGELLERKCIAIDKINNNHH